MVLGGAAQTPARTEVSTSAFLLFSALPRSDSFLQALCSPAWARHTGVQESGGETSAWHTRRGSFGGRAARKKPDGVSGRTVFGEGDAERTRRAPQAAGGFMCRRWAQTGEPDCPRSARMASYMQAACSLAVKQNGANCVRLFLSVASDSHLLLSAPLRQREAEPLPAWITVRPRRGWGTPLDSSLAPIEILR